MLRQSACSGSLLALLAGFAGMLVAGQARAERLKDLVTIQGVRANQLIGYGLVVGLDGSGDQTTQTPFTVQSIMAMLSQMGVNLPPGTSLQLKNVAAVMVTAQLPAFARPGQTIDVTVSSMGNAKSLRGGTLLLTPLKGADGQIYAMAQGNVLIAGAGDSAGGSKTQINQLNAGRIPAGATVGARRRQHRSQHRRLACAWNCTLPISAPRAALPTSSIRRWAAAPRWRSTAG